MKYTSIITAAAVLSASTFAAPFQAKFSVGVEGSHFSLEGERQIGTALTEAEITALAAGTDENSATSFHYAVGGSKNLVGLKVAANMKMSDRFSLEASAIMSSGTLELTNTSDGIYIGGNAAANAVHGLIERLTLKIKPTYGFGIKALFGFNDSFQIGPEVRLQRFENTAGGKIGTAGLRAVSTFTTFAGEHGTTATDLDQDPKITATDSTSFALPNGDANGAAINAGGTEITLTPGANNGADADVTNTDGLVSIDLNGATLFTDEVTQVYTVDTTKTTQTDTFFGVAIVGKLNDKLSVAAGYNMATAKQHEFKVDSTMTADASRQMTGTATAVDKFNLETEKPKVHNCYAGVQFSF